MPIYEYECLSCGKIHEKMQKFNEELLSVCPACSGALRKIISNTSFVLKGTGWYKTDYASPSKKERLVSDKKSETETGIKTDPKTDFKTEPKAETKTETATKA